MMLGFISVGSAGAKVLLDEDHKTLPLYAPPIWDELGQRTVKFAR